MELSRSFLVGFKMTPCVFYHGLPSRYRLCSIPGCILCAQTIFKILQHPAHLLRTVNLQTEEDIMNLDDFSIACCDCLGQSCQLWSMRPG
jgi:hypothetical protein